MAHRKNKSLIRIDSEPVQGEGSFVLIKNPTWDDCGEEFAKDQTAQALTIAILNKVVVDWDWVDDNDRPLPKPADDPGIIGRLPLAELLFLGTELETRLGAIKPKN